MIEHVGWSSIKFGQDGFFQFLAFAFFNQSVNQSINQSINLSTNQLINQPTNQLVNLLFKRGKIQ